MPTDSDDEQGPLHLETGQASVSSDSDQAKSPIDSQHGKLDVVIFTLVFFFAMIGHELALEAASTEFSDLDALAYAVTLFQFGFCVLLPLAVSFGKAASKFPRRPLQFVPYIRLSIFVFGATALSSKSLQYVTYPTKVVFKSAKLIPTMMVATILHRKRFGWLDYLAALMLCGGAAGYSYGTGTNMTDVDSSSWKGIVLLTISIICDAVVPNMQQRLMKSNETSVLLSPKPSSPKPPPSTKLPPKLQGSLTATELMVNVNSVGFLGLLCYMVVMGQLSQAVNVSTQHPRLAMYLAMVGVGLGTAVLAYTRLIQCTGSVSAVAVATLRKVATMVLSYVVWPKPLLTIHLVSALLALGGILLSTYSKQIGNRK